MLLLCYCHCLCARCMKFHVHVHCVNKSHACSSVKVLPDGMESLITLSEGDMRRALNILQVYTCTLYA